MQHSADGWKFTTKQDPHNVGHFQPVTYQVAYFEDGFPWIHDKESPRLRKPTNIENYWGTLTEPGMSEVSNWDRVVKKNKNSIAKAIQWLHDTLNDPKERFGDQVVSQGLLEHEMDLEHPSFLIQPVLRLPEFEAKLAAFGISYTKILLIEGH